MNEITQTPAAYQNLIGNHNVITGRGSIYVHDSIAEEVINLRPIVNWIQEIYEMPYDNHSSGRGIKSAIAGAKQMYIGMLEAIARDPEEVMECGNAEMERHFMSQIVKVLASCCLEHNNDLQVRDR